ATVPIPPFLSEGSFEDAWTSAHHGEAQRTPHAYPIYFSSFVRCRLRRRSSLSPCFHLHSTQPPNIILYSNSTTLPARHPFGACRSNAAKRSAFYTLTCTPFTRSRLTLLTIHPTCKSCL